MLDFNDSAFVDTDFDTVHDPVFGATMIDSDSDGVIDAFNLTQMVMDVMIPVQQDTQTARS